MVFLENIWIFYLNDFDFLQVEVFKRADQDHLKDIFLKVSASKDQSLFKCYMYILFMYLCLAKRSCLTIWIRLGLLYNPIHFEDHLTTCGKIFPVQSMLQIWILGLDVFCHSPFGLEHPWSFNIESLYYHALLNWLR